MFPVCFYEETSVHRDMFWPAAHGHADSHAAVKSHSNPEGIVIHTTKNPPVAIMGNPESAKELMVVCSALGLMEEEENRCLQSS